MAFVMVPNTIDGGDCDFYNKYPNCTATYPPWIEDGICEGVCNTDEYGFDEGDCDVSQLHCHLSIIDWRWHL
jgi:hypothetical protein